MWIDVCIPFNEKNKLAEAYNRSLADGTSDWVLFLDHDVFLCNPHWYEMCIEAILTLHHDPMAACIGCESGGEHHKKTMKGQGPPNGMLEDHIGIAKGEYFKFGNMIQRIHVPVPGFFMLLKRDVAKEIGFVQRRRSINNVDTDFGKRLMKAGYHIYQMRGLYVYHRRGMKHLKKEFIIDES